MKNHLNNKSLIGLAGHKSILAKNFIKTYKSQFKFKLYKNDINNYKKFKKWVCQNKDLNYFINFAAMTSVADCDKNKVKALLTNYKSVTKMTKIFQTEHLNLPYFLKFVLYINIPLFQLVCIQLLINNYILLQQKFLYMS